jgi:hypothetical protein
MPLTYKLGISFLSCGVLSIVVSYLLTSQILAFSGIGLSFWGALFLIITPKRYVESEIASYTLLPLYSSADRIIRHLDCKGKGIHIPSFPPDVYLPDHLKGLKETVVFIPKAEEIITTPSIDELAKGKFIVEKPEGLLLTPPGLLLLTRIEEKTRLDLTKTPLNDLCEILPKNILENFGLAKEITLILKDDELLLKIRDSIYKDLYGQGTKSINLLGCPIVSLVACAIAKSSGKPVTISGVKYSPDDLFIQAKYKINISE